MERPSERIRIFFNQQGDRYGDLMVELPAHWFIFNLPHGILLLRASTNLIKGESRTRV
jgi:hypothetical protein